MTTPRHRRALAILALAAAAVLVVGAAPGAAEKTWYVDDDGGEGIDYMKIQDAVNNASDGDAIEVRSGTYPESVDLDKQLVLMGVDTCEGKPAVGNYTEYGGGGTLITIAVDGCTVCGFNVTGSEHRWEDVGIKIESSNNTIANNVISFINGHGIVLLGSSNNNTISTNGIYFNDAKGIWLRDDCAGNHLIDNNVCFNSDDGIKLEGGCDNCTLIGNNVSFNDDKGIDLDDDCFDCRLIDNDVCFNGDHGIELDWDSFNGTLINNNASFNGGIGICIHCDNNTLYDNTVLNNTGGIYLDEIENCILRNNTINNNMYNFNVVGGGVHDIDTSNTINGKKIYYLIDREDIVIDPSWNAGYIGIVDSNSITVRDLTMTGNGQGIIFYEVENSRIENVTIMGNIYGICLIGSSGITLKNNYAHSNWKYGILVDWGYDNSIDTSNIVNGKPVYYFYDIHDQTICNLNTTHLTIAESSNIIIEDNNVNDGDGIYLFGIEDSVISNNRISGNFYGMVADRSDNNTFRNNSANRNKDTGMHIHWDSNNNTIANNHADENEQYGIKIGGGEFNSIVDNHVIANKKHGIRLSHADDNIVSGNYVAFNSRGGIQVAHDSNYNKIANNNASFNDWYGIYVSSSSTNNIIAANTISGNNNGISLHDANNNEFINNIISSNRYDGLDLGGSSNNNTITDNTISLSGGTGVQIELANDNKIFHNNFINNAEQADDDGDNFWDNGYPSGGNYWSDHTCTGNPSDGSQPYTIGGGAGAVDRYPFESMNGWLTTLQKGDLNHDNQITPADAAIALQLAATGAHDDVADVSGDGYVTSLDALMILREAAVNIYLDRQIKIGTLLPLTGDFAAYGGPMQDATQLAVKHVKENGGVLESNVTLVSKDSETSESAAIDAMNQLVTVDCVPAVIGAAGSGVSLAIIDIAVENQIVQISPSNTAPVFTTYEDDGFYWRTAPSDALQGKTMAKLACDSGYVNASTLVINDSYGVWLEEVFKDEFEKLGGTVTNRVKYDSCGAPFDSEVDQVSTGDPDVIALIGYSDTGNMILKTAYEKGVMDESDWLLCEWMRTDELAEMVGNDTEDEYIVADIIGIAPDPRATGPAHTDFAAAYEAEYGREPAIFCSNAYDAAVIIALAIEEAGSADGTTIRDAMPDVANPPGVEVSDIGTALALIRNGTAINYQGASGNITFDYAGDVAGAYCQWQISDNGSVTLGESIPVE